MQKDNPQIHEDGTPVTEPTQLPADVDAHCDGEGDVYHHGTGATHHMGTGTSYHHGGGATHVFGGGDIHIHGKSAIHYHDKKTGSNDTYAGNPAGSGANFKKLKSTLGKRKGVRSPGALSAFIMRNKYGAEKSAKMSVAGRARNA